MRTDTSAIAWKKIDLNAGVKIGETKLLGSEPIQCRLVDLEGRPAANIKLHLQAIMTPVKEAKGSRRNAVANEAAKRLHFFSFKPLKAQAWIQGLRTDENGVLTIPNIAGGQGVYVAVLPTDELAPQSIALNTGMPEERGERDGTYRPIVKNMQPGAVATIPLSPAKFFEGVVQFADTGKPAANARIEIWASQQQFGSMSAIFDKTDAQGRFKLNPKPGIRYGITAYPPEGAPYRAKRHGGMRGFPWTSGEETKNIKIELNPGAIVAGRVVDEATGKPIVNAAVEYRPMALNPNKSEHDVNGWQGTKKTNDRGEFRIPAMPGEGWLLVHSNNRDYVLRQKTGRQLSYEKPGGERIYAHAFKKINPSKSESNIGEIKLKPSKTVTLEVRDSDGNPIAEGLAISRLHVSVHAGWWRGQNPDVIKDGRVEIAGLDEGVDVPIYLLDPKRKLGAVAKVNASQAKQIVTLEPCGSAVIRYVNQNGKPLADKGLAFHMVVTPGVTRFDLKAMRDEGAAAADADFISNIDRLNHWDNRSGEDGRLVIPALIPGATYRYPSVEDRLMVEFVAKSGETLEIGDRTIKEEE